MFCPHHAFIVLGTLFAMPSIPFVQAVHDLGFAAGFILKPCHLSATDPTVVRALHPAAVASLLAALHAPAISADVISALTPEQAAAIPATALPALSSEQLAAVSALKGVPVKLRELAEQIRLIHHVTSPHSGGGGDLDISHQLREIPDTVMASAADGLGTELSAWTADAIALLPAPLLRALSAQQLWSLTSTQVQV